MNPAAVINYLIFFALIGAAVLYLRSHVRAMLEREREAKAKPTLAQYLGKHPNCRTDHGIKCYVCNSRSIRSWGYESARDERRLFKCSHCDTTLYRTENW